MAMLCLSISTLAYDFEVDGIAYTITSFSDLTCSVAASDAPYEGEIVVPSNVMFKGKALTVTSISSSAFKNSHIASVQIPETVIKIEARAFANCENLGSTVIKEGLKSIGNDAFNGCINLSKIDFPTSLKTIGAAGFANCKSLSQITLPNATNLGESAFYNCENLLKVSLPNIVTLEAHVFSGCLNLHKIELGNKLEKIEDYAFANCDFTTFIIPNTVTNIGKSILLNNENLQSFTIGNGIRKISSDPIAECPNVSELIIADGTTMLTFDFSPEDYTEIEIDDIYRGEVCLKYYCTRPGAYSNKKFEYIYVGRTLGNPYTKKENTLYHNPRYYYNYTLPTFYGNKNIKYVTIGPNVSRVYGVEFSCEHKSFNYGWLEGCSNIEMITIRGLEVIPKLFAKDAISLKTVEMLNTTSYVGEKAFYNCVSLETIMFGTKLSTIGSNAFENCNALASIYCKSKNPPTYSTGFNKDIYLNCKLYIPFGTELSYKCASPWNNFWNMSESQECGEDFMVGDLIYSITTDNNVIVSGNIVADERDIVIPSHVEYNETDYNVVGIGKSSFERAPINSIVIPGCISNIYNNAFNGCSKLKSITMEYSSNAIIIGHKSALQLSDSITQYPNATTVDERRTGFRDGYYDGLFNGLPIEHLVINRNIELPKYYERAVGSSTSNYSTVYNDIIYYPPFYGLTNLKSVEIGENVSAICKNQIEAVVNAVPTTIEYTNFGQCDKIEVVVSNSPKAPVGGGFSQNVYENATLFLPNGGEESYQRDDYWKRFSQIMNSPFISTESITFDSEEVVIDINESMTLSPVINPEDASIKKLKWSSSEPSIVSVSEDGTISSNSRDGEANITVTSCDGSGISASIKVIVQEGAGVSDVLVDCKLDISVKGSKLYIRGKADTDNVSVYNVQGQRIITTNDNEIELGTKGIYIVQIGSVRKKVII